MFDRNNKCIFTSFESNIIYIYYGFSTFAAFTNLKGKQMFINILQRFINIL